MTLLKIVPLIQVKCIITENKITARYLKTVQNA